MEQKFQNAELERAVAMAKEMGLKVWAWETATKTIRQVFIDNGAIFGSIEAFYEGLLYTTCHQPARSIQI